MAGHLLYGANMVNAQTSTNEQLSDGSKQQLLTEIASTMNPNTIDSMYMILGDDKSPGRDTNPLAQFMSIPDSNQEEENKMAITHPAKKTKNKDVGVTAEGADESKASQHHLSLVHQMTTPDVAGTPGLISDTSSVYINIAGQQLNNHASQNDLSATLRNAKLDPKTNANLNNPTKPSNGNNSKLLGLLQ